MSSNSIDALALPCRKKQSKPRSAVSPSGVFWSVPAACRMHTHLHAPWLSQNSNAWKCLPIHTAVEDHHPPALAGEQERGKKRLTEGWQLSINRFLCCRAQDWWENASCYLSPPTPLVFCLCLWFLAHTLSISLLLPRSLPPSLSHAQILSWLMGSKHTS